MQCFVASTAFASEEAINCNDESYFFFFLGGGGVDIVCEGYVT